MAGEVAAAGAAAGQTCLGNHVRNSVNRRVPNDREKKKKVMEMSDWAEAPEKYHGACRKCDGQECGLRCPN